MLSSNRSNSGSKTFLSLRAFAEKETTKRERKKERVRKEQNNMNVDSSPLSLGLVHQESLTVIPYFGISVLRGVSIVVYNSMLLS
jgi:hypothetical protein